MLGVLDRNEIEEVLTKQLVGRIGCHARDTTYIVPVSYAYDGKYIYGHTGEGMKIEFMRINPAVCFEVEEIKDMANWKSVVSWGQFEELNDHEERKKGLHALANRLLPLISSETTHLTPHWPFQSNDIHTIKGIVFRIELHTKSGRFENNSVTREY